MDYVKMVPMEKATFAAGCFWGVEKIFRQLEGVLDARVGYLGGQTANPDYESVCSGSTGHAEALEVVYDPKVVRYWDLLDTFWSWHDPTTLNRQGPDIGSQYRSVIFYHNDHQKNEASSSKKILNDSGVFGSAIVTEIVPAARFYTAENYHQNYLKKNPGGYCSHRRNTEKIHEILNPAKIM
jgi:peptide-methionine (S)-S-oxide reductase